MFYQQDYLGSTRIITDQNGALVSRIDYEPFGSELIDTTKAKYTFTGKEEDPSTGLQYFGARYYDVETGRFTQTDPSYDAATSPYAYVENNPLIKTDPTGMYSWNQFKTDWNYAWETGPIMGAWNSLVNINDYIIGHQGDIDVVANNMVLIPAAGVVGKAASEAIAADKAIVAGRAAAKAAAAADEVVV